LKNGSPLKLLNGTSTHETNITNGMSHGDQLNKVKLNNLETAPKIDLKLPKVPPKVENSSTVSSADFNTSTATTVPKSEKLKTLQLNGHVGFDSLPHQLVRKCTEQGYIVVNV
uniref:BRCT domain-containing protein n=1 Tax=Anisakis simplex TaxID=6269 RepID=A0A0M3JIJ6_ANISI